MHDLARLLIARPAWVAVPLAIASVLFWIGWRLRRTTHHHAAVTLLISAIVLAAAGGANIANIYYGYLPRAGDVLGIPSWPTLEPVRADNSGIIASLGGTSPSLVRSGGVTSIPVPDPASAFGFYRALVYLPPQYLLEPARRFPVLYLLHGSPGVPLDWLRGGEAAAAGAAVAATGHPMIIVMPRDSHWWLDDPECVDGQREQVETYVTVDVVQAVDATLRTIPDRTHRAVGGMSAGGYCALNLGLRHRDTYAAILDMSGFTAPTHTGGLGALFGAGAAGKARERANTPAAYVAELSPTPAIAVWMDAGTSDSLVQAQMRPVVAALRDLGFPVRFGTRPGAHTFRVWAPALREALPWVADRFDS